MPVLIAGERGRVVRFLLVGLLNTGVGYALYAGLIFTGLPAQAALLIATILAVLFNFQSTGRLVFDQRGSARGLAKFIGVYAISYVCNAMFLAGLTITANVPPLIAQLICLPVIVVMNYFLIRNLVFSGANGPRS